MSALGSTVNVTKIVINSLASTINRMKAPSPPHTDEERQQGFERLEQILEIVEGDIDSKDAQYLRLAEVLEKTKVELIVEPIGQTHEPAKTEVDTLRNMVEHQQHLQSAQRSPESRRPPF